MRFTSKTCLVCALIVGLGTAVFAQPKPPADPPVPPLEQLIYLPYKNLKTVLDLPDGAVFMPFSQYETLWDAFKLKPTDGKPPVGAVLTQTVYTGTIEKEVARLNAEFTVRVLGKPWVQLPIQFGDAAIGKITSPDNKVLLQATGNGTYVLLFPEAGEHKLQLELVTKIRTSPDGRSFELACPAAGVTTVDLTVPTADQTVELIGTADAPATGAANGLVTPVEGDAAVTHVKAQLGATNKITARWRPRVSTAPVMELLSSVQGLHHVRVADGLVHTQTTLTYQVQRGQLDQLRIAAPLGTRILDVTAPGLKSWKATAEEKQQLIVVDLVSPEAKTIAVQILTERSLPTEAFAVAGLAEDGTASGLHALGGVRESGLVVLSQAPDLTLAVEQQAGAVRVEAADAPESLRTLPEAQFYKYYTPKFLLQISAKAVEPRVTVAHQAQVTFTDDEQRIESNLQYTVERAGVFELRFKLPAGLTIDRVDCEAMKEFQVPTGSDTLVISLKEKTKGTIGVTIAGHRPLDPAVKESQSLPILEPLAVARETGALRVFAPDAIEVITDEKGLQGAQPSRDQQTQSPPPGTRLASAWTWSRRPLEVPVRTSRRPTRLSAGIATLIKVGEATVEVETQLNYQVEYAGLDTFRLAVPKSIAGVQIDSGDTTSLPIKQKSSEESGDWTIWTIVLQHEATGLVPLRIRYDFKTARKEQAGGAEFSVLLLRALPSPGQGAEAAEIPLSGLAGEVSLQKDQSLSITAKGTDVEAIDVRDLKTLPSTGYLAYRYFRQPEQLTSPFKLDLTSTVHALQAVAETVILKSAIEAVLTDSDKSVLYRCRYLVKTSERQRLPLDLPLDAELLDTQVAGRKVDLEVNPEPAKGDLQPFYVNLAQIDANQQFVISLIFRAPFRDRPLTGTGGQLGLKFLQIGSQAADGEKTLAPVLETRTAVWVPRHYTLVGEPAGFTSVRLPGFDPLLGIQASTTETTDLDRWFGANSTGLFDFTTAGSAFQYQRLGAAVELNVVYWRVANYTWIISGAVALIGLLLAFTTWENRLGVVAIAVFVACLWALFDVDLVLHTVSVARWGLVAALAFWLIRALSRARAPKGSIDFRHRGCAIAAVIPPPGVFNVRSSETKPTTAT